jgi:hypothetical protein
MNFKKITPIFTVILFAAVFIAIAVYDVWAILEGGTEASISHWIIISSYKFPFAVYMTGLVNGILIGHLFWRMKSTPDTKDVIGE